MRALLILGLSALSFACFIQSNDLAAAGFSLMAVYFAEG
jgi:hypothetical protein